MYSKGDLVKLRAAQRLGISERGFRYKMKAQSIRLWKER
ncbi:MAG: hypothetical protein KA126_01270 [Candidatus Hydrothermae bacterium]|nr:hypothetical protein [Candidatus Hydrothermae bacterium]